MGKLTHSQMIKLLETTLDTMDRYNRIIRQLLDENDDTDDSIKKEKEDDSIVIKGDVNIKNINQQIEKVQYKLNNESTNVSITNKKSKNKKPNVYDLAKTYIKDNDYVNKDNYTDNSIIFKLYGDFRDHCRNTNLRPMGKFAFREIVENYFNKSNIDEEPKTECVSGVHDYLLTPDNVDSIKPLLRVGDVVGIQHETLGVIAFQVAGINIDGPEVVTLISKDCVARRKFDSETGIYKDSEIRKWLNEDFLLQLNIMDKIVAVEKKSFGDYSHLKLVKSIDYCWLPSRDEMMIDEMGSDDIVENNKYPLFNDATSRIKKWEGRPGKYYTRSMIKCDMDTDTYKNIYSKSPYLVRIKDNGQMTQGSCTSAFGIVVGLCI